MTKNLTLRLAAIPAFVLASASSAHAALPTGVSDAVTAYQTDATTGIGLMMAAGVVVWGLLVLKRKLGW